HRDALGRAAVGRPDGRPSRLARQHFRDLGTCCRAEVGGGVRRPQPLRASASHGDRAARGARRDGAHHARARRGARRLRGGGPARGDGSTRFPDVGLVGSGVVTTETMKDVRDRLFTMLMTVRVLSEQGPVRVELARWQDRLVVVKSLRGFHPVFRQRLEREAAVVGKLRHDNIVPLLGAKDGSLIYAYCPGVSLEEALERGPLRPRRSVKIIADVLEALAYAHTQGVIHLDVKPGNILVKGESAL